MAVRFDAATDRISLAATIPDPSAGFTLLGWAYVSVDRDDFSTMARVHASSGASTTVTFATGSEGLGGPGYFTGGGSVTNATGFTVGAWRKVAISCTGTTGRCYVATDGGSTEADSGTVGGAASPTGITLGGRSPVDGAEWFNGRLAYWRLYSAELTQAEIETEWASATPVRTSNLWADWPLEVHTDLTDHSGNGRNLSAGSTATTTEDGPPVSSAITGTGAVTAPAATVSGAGGVVAAGTGSATAPSATLTGTGSALVAGTGSVTSPPATVAGAGNAVVSGTGSAFAPAALLSGTGEVLLAGQGGATGPPAAVAGAGQVIVTGTGAVIAPAAVLSGSAGEPGEPVVTPESRTVIVPAENRVLVVAAESRVLEA